MDDLKIKRKYDRVTVVHRLNLKTEQLNIQELQLIASGELPGLHPIEVEYGRGGKAKLTFTAVSRMDLAARLMSGVPFAQFVQLIRQVIAVISGCRARGVQVTNLELDPELIFVNTATREVQMLLWPVIAVAAYPDFRRFFRDLGLYYRPIQGEEQLRARYLGYIEQGGTFDLPQLDRRLVEWLNEACRPEPPRPVPGGEDDVRLWSDTLCRASTGETVTLTRYPFRIGRLPEFCDFPLLPENSRISREHLVLEKHEQSVWAVDKSRNGTLLNGMPMEKGKYYPLRSGDRLRIEQEELIFKRAGG